MKCRFALTALIAACFIGPGHGLADRVTLKDGRVISGTMNRQGEQIEIKQADGLVVSVKPDQITKVELNNEGQSSTQKAAADLERLQDQSAHLDDPAEIAKLYSAYIDQHPDAAGLDQIKILHNQFENYAQQHFVRFGGEWMSQAQRDTLLREVDGKALAALNIYRSGKPKEALDLVKTVLAQQSTNAIALSVAGLASYRLNDAKGAYEYFNRLTAAEKTNVLGWNNTAILNFQFKRQPEALADYSKALELAPGNRLLLDNIADALNSYTGSTENPVFIKLSKQFSEADAKMQAEMAQKGYLRFGSTWVTQAQKDRIGGFNQVVQDRIGEIQKQFDQDTASLNSLDGALQQINNFYYANGTDLNSLNWLILQQQSLGYLDYGLMAQRDAILGTYNSTAAQRRVLLNQHDQLAQQIQQLKTTAEKLRDSLVAYTGFQRLMEIGDVESPPPPAVINIPANLPAARAGLAPPPVAPQPVVQVPVPVQSSLVDGFDSGVVIINGGTFLPPIAVPFNNGLGRVKLLNLPITQSPNILQPTTGNEITPPHGPEIIQPPAGPNINHPVTGR